MIIFSRKAKQMKSPHYFKQSNSVLNFNCSSKRSIRPFESRVLTIIMTRGRSFFNNSLFGYEYKICKHVKLVFPKTKALALNSNA